ncbi:hypothetical protein, partial [Staphylococcus epidermidis]
MEVENWCLEVFPIVSEYYFFRDTMDSLNPEKIINFNSIEENDNLNFQITFSALDLVRNPHVDSDSIYLVFLFYDKLSDNNVNI